MLSSDNFTDSAKIAMFNTHITDYCVSKHDTISERSAIIGRCNSKLGYSNHKMSVMHHENPQCVHESMCVRVAVYTRRYLIESHDRCCA